MARTPVRVRGGGVHLEGYTEAMRGLNRFNREAAKELNNSLRDVAKDLRDKAWREFPGGGRADIARGTGITSKTKMFGYSVTTKGAAIRSRVASAPSTYPSVMEFGEDNGYVPVFKGKFRRGYVRPIENGGGGPATARAHRPPSTSDLRRNTGGYMLLPVFRRELPRVDEEVVADLVTAYNVAMRQAGAL